MQRRFTLIEGGLSDRRRTDAGAAGAAPVRWRVSLRRPNAVDAVEVAAWRALIARGAEPDPFSDPDYLLTAAQHGAQGLELAFALAWSQGADGTESLRGVLPLAMSRPARGGVAASLWQPPLARASAPILDADLAEAALTALLDHLRIAQPRASLRLDGIRAASPLMRSAGEGRLHLDIRATASPVPAARVVDVGPRASAPPAEPEVERITDRRRIRDGVEQFLALDARTARAPLIANPIDATLVRVATRLFARRHEVSVELERSDGEIVSGSISLGEGARVPWLGAGLHAARPARPETVDVVATLRHASGGDAPLSGLRFVASADR